MVRLAIVIDDEKDIVGLIMSTLANNGWSVIGFTSAVEAVQFMKKHRNLPISLQIVDLMMPKVSGVMFMQKMHILEKKIPTVIVSGSDDLLVLDDFTVRICKPFAQDELLQAISSVVKDDNEHVAKED